MAKVLLSQPYEREGRYGRDFYETSVGFGRLKAVPLRGYPDHLIGRLAVAFDDREGYGSDDPTGLDANNNLSQPIKTIENEEDICANLIGLAIKDAVDMSEFLQRLAQ